MHPSVWFHDCLDLSGIEHWCTHAVRISVKRPPEIKTLVPTCCVHFSHMALDGKNFAGCAASQLHTMRNDGLRLSAHCAATLLL